MKKLEDLKKLQDKRIELIEEFTLAKKLENNEILYKKIHDQFGYFHLIDLKKNKIVSSGPIGRINSYIRLRNIDPEKII